MPMTKKDKVTLRQEAIKELITQYPIEDQQTLVDMMQQHHNIETNQSIVSRDLRILGISKHKTRDKMIYELPQFDASQEILHLAVVEITYNESLIIIKTRPGLASFVADYLDLQQDLQILGTIAGENTLFVAPESTKKSKEIAQKIALLLNYKEEL